MHAYRILAIATTAVIVSACASQQTAWLMGGKTEAQLANDQDQCMAEAKRTVMRTPVHESKVQLTGLANLINIFEEKSRDNEYEAALRDFTDNCMRAKGWKAK